MDRDAGGRSPLPIQGYGTYAPGWTIGASATTSAAAAEYDKLRATAIAFSDSEGYIPNIEGFINGGYSTDVSPFDVGTGELMVEYYLGMLNSMKDK